MQLAAVARSLPGRTRGLWDRSLQLRVAATTLLVTGVFVFIVGVFLVNQIGAGVLRAKTNTSKAQALAEVQTIQTQLAGVSPGDLSGARRVLSQLNNAPDVADTGLFWTSVSAVDPTLQSSLGDQPAVPDSLSEVIRGGNSATQYAEEVPPGSSGHAVAVYIFGQSVTTQSGDFELYFIFPLQAEVKTIALVQRTVLLAGLGLMLLIAAIATLVTRQVVRPVGVAAQTAERLAAGDLAQRISVRGDDELALLARSFNDMAASLQRQFRRLEDLSRLQRRFTSDVSHELRTPLTTVRMAAEILHSRRADFPPDLARSAELMLDELDRFELLLADLLEISRYDAGVARLDVETVDVRGVVDRAIAASQVLADKQGSVIEVEAPNGRVTADLDPRRIERVLRNLLGNAIDHGEGQAGAGDDRRLRRRPDDLCAGPRRRAASRGGGSGVQPLLAGRSLPQSPHRRYRTGVGDQLGGRPSARWLAAGMGRTWRGRAVPAHGPAARGDATRVATGSADARVGLGRRA